MCEVCEVPNPSLAGVETTAQAFSLWQEAYAQLWDNYRLTDNSSP